jgi:hypothetical protein
VEKKRRRHAKYTDRQININEERTDEVETGDKAVTTHHEVLGPNLDTDSTRGTSAKIIKCRATDSGFRP